VSEHEEPSEGAAGDAGATTCAECGATLPAGQKFCTTCGAAVPSATGMRGILDASHKRALAVIGAVVAVIVIIVLATSGGGDDDSAVESPPPTEETVPTTEPPPTTTTIPVAPGGTWVVTGSDDRGYSSRVTLAIGKPKHADPNEDEESFGPDREYDIEGEEDPIVEKRIGACAVTKATDAIVPVEVSLENTTGNFPEILGMVLELETYPGGAVSVQSDSHYSTGAECTDPNDSDDSKLWGVQSLGAIDAGETEEYREFLIVLHNYYSPAYPDGDVAAYESMRLTPELSFGDTFGEDERRVRDVAISQLAGSGAPTFQLVTSSDGF
jgi:hypothetical protein